jgi:glycosyltransferase involved in cell wall biosynthesis
MSTVLYITYDGLLEPLGQSQVLPYLLELARERRVHILSFEKPSDRRDAAAMHGLRERLAAAGIGWTPLTYHKRPSAPATAFDVAAGTVAATWLALRQRARILHVRSYVPALIALPVRFLTRAKLVFDMRGFWADERVDGGLWPRGGTLYRITKRLESRFLFAADHVVTLTDASARELRDFPALRQVPKPISVIPTCADLGKFRPPPDDQMPPGFVFGYVGSVGTWYLFPQTLAFFLALLRRRPDARLLVVNRHEHGLIRRLMTEAGVPADRLELVSASHDAVAGHIRRMHLGAALIRPSYSKIASAPTKMAEYLGCGVPCVGNAGVGDVAQILRGRNVGVVLEGLSDQDIETGVDRALALAQDPGVRSRCVAAATDLFSLERGVAAYRDIYQSLLSAA